MRVAQYVNTKINKNTNKSFQREVWDIHWSETSFQELITQLDRNPVYWRLTHLLHKKYKILEAGCGFGQWVLKLNNHGYKIEGVDNAKKTIKKIKSLHPELKIIEADVEKLPYKSKSFDAYLSFGVIEHFEGGPEKVLIEAHRVLKKGGLLYLTVPYLNIFRYLKFIRTKQQKGNFYQYLYTKNDIVKRIEESGFKISEVRYYDFINAVIRDFPLVMNIYRKITKYIIKGNTNSIIKSPSQSINIKKETKEPTFFWQKILYKIDSYIILIEATKK